MALCNDFKNNNKKNNQTKYNHMVLAIGTRRIRSVQRVPYVPDMNIGRPLFRARQLHAHPVREQHHVMLQDRVNQDMLQHNIQQQHNIAYNHRPYQDQQIIYCRLFKKFAMILPFTHHIRATRKYRSDH